jgi:hypothetical protein
VKGSPSSLCLAVVLSFCACLLAPATARAQPRYQLFYGNPQIVDTNTTTPQRITHSSANAQASYNEACYAIPGHVMSRVRLNASKYGNDGAAAYESTDDFVITGPAGPATVSATV